MRAKIDESMPFPNLIAWEGMPEGTIALVQPGQQFDVVGVDAVTTRYTWNPRQQAIITGLSNIKDAK